MADFNLPNEIWCKIFSYLPLAPKKNATATCRLWFRLIREDPKLSGYTLISWNNTVSVDLRVNRRAPAARRAGASKGLETSCNP